MKKILKLIPLVLLAVTLNSCDEDLASGATDTVGFEDSTADVGVNVGEETEEVIFVYTGNVTSGDRTFSVSVDAEATTADPTAYDVPSQVVIPGGTNVGELPVFLRDINLGDGVSIVLNLASEGSTVLLQDTITINVTQV
jgi:hypothetical protein